MSFLTRPFSVTSGGVVPPLVCYLYCVARKFLLLFCNIAVAAMDRVIAGGVVPMPIFCYRIPLLFSSVKNN